MRKHRGDPPIEPTETIEPIGREFALIGRDFEFWVSANSS